MSDWIKCDCCGNDRQNETAARTFSWLHVERALVRIGEPGQLDFCSWACMEAYAGAQKTRAWQEAKTS